MLFFAAGIILIRCHFRYFFADTAGTGSILPKIIQLLQGLFQFFPAFLDPAVIPGIKSFLKFTQVHFHQASLIPDAFLIKPFTF